MRCRVRNSPNSVRCRFGWLAKHREGTTPITVIEKMHRVAPLVPQARAPHHRYTPASTFYARHATSNPVRRRPAGPALRPGAGRRAQAPGPRAPGLGPWALSPPATGAQPFHFHLVELWFPANYSREPLRLRVRGGWRQRLSQLQVQRIRFT